MGEIRFVSRGRAAWLAVLITAVLVATLAMPLSALAEEYATYATAEEAAADYATGVLTGDTEMASRAAGQELDANALDTARLDLFGTEDAVDGAVAHVVRGPDAATSPGGRSQRANLFEIESYETAEGETVAVDASDRTPEIWVSDVEPWRVVPVGSQQAGQLFIKILLVALGVGVVTVVVVLIRMADTHIGEAPEEDETDAGEE